jgi:hypothetical protein
MNVLASPLPLARRAAALLFTGVLAALLFAPAGHAQERANSLPRTSPNAAAGQTVGVTDVRITYARPSVNGREIFGELVPYGDVWRTGANEATTITFSDDVEVEGEPLAAGTYSLFTIPGREEWTLIFNETADQWGAFEYDESRDAARVQVTPEEAPHRHEQMAFHFGRTTDAGTQVALVWGRTRVPFTIEADTDANVRARAEAAVTEADDWRAPYQYAAYALENDLYPETALDWTDRSIALGENFYNTALKARLLASVERYDDARRHAERAMAMADEMDETPRGLDQFEQQMADWRSR